MLLNEIINIGNLKELWNFQIKSEMLLPFCLLLIISPFFYFLFRNWTHEINHLPKFVNKIYNYP